MRLLVASPYFPPHVGGLESYVRDLNEELLQLGLVESITVLAPRLPPQGAPRERPRPGYQIVRHPAVDLIPNFPCPSLWRPGCWTSARAALAIPHDLVVSHTRFFLSSAAALAYSRAARLPLLHVEHGSDHVHLDSALNTRIALAYDRSLGRAVLRGARAVVAISQAAARFVEDLSGREARVIYRGVDPDRYERVEPDPELRRLGAGRPVVAFVGRLIDGKGVADLLDAFAGLEGSRALLALVGDGPRRGDLEAQAARLGLGERCRFFGYLPEQRALAMLRAADVVVNPSYTEGLPTSVLEAAMLGRAILASDVGGTPEIVRSERDGVLVAAHDVAALRRGLEVLLADEALCERLGSSVRRQALERFDRERAARDFAELAAAAIDSRRAAG